MRTPRLWLCGAAAFTLLGGCAHEEVRQNAGTSGDLAHRASQQPTKVAASDLKPELTEDPSVPAVQAPPATPQPPPLKYVEGPSLEDWKLVPVPSSDAGPGFDATARISALAVTLYAKPDAKTVVGYTGVGESLPARKVAGSNCRGDWYEVTGDAFLCSSDTGVTIDTGSAQRDPAVEALVRTLAPRVDRPSPYHYGKARRPAVLLSRMPKPDELKAVDSGKVPDDLLQQTLNGTYLLSLVDEETVGQERFYRTLSGGYIRAQDVKPFPKAPMHGEHLGRREHLPLAFTVSKTPLYCLDQEEPTPCGVADKHARFPAGQEVNREGRSFLLMRDKLMVPRQNVRIARRIPRPSGVSKGERWVHIDLSEQTLVAYAGDKPVFATLVSTGKPGHDTVTGLFKVQRAFLTKPMNGVDDEGPYQVQEVPWTMYFYGNYALHGAYWHDVFGNTRSHGCVNIPPADARWLFYWSKPLPAGWTARVGFQGVHVYVSGKTPPAEESDVAKAS